MKHLIFLLFLLSCGDDTFRKVEQLDRFRILGIQAASPEVAPGGSSTLTLLIYDPSPRASITTTLTTCIDPGISLGAPVSCAHDSTAIPSSFTINTSTYTANLGLGTHTTAAINVPAAIFTGRSTRDQFNGVGYIAIFDLVVDGEPVRAFKRIVATNRGSLNSNPAAPTLLLNGAAFAGTPQKGDRLSLTTSAPESYQFQNVDGTTETRIEDLQVAWYITKAELLSPKTRVDESTKIETDPSSDPYLILGVVRDERGGLSFTSRTVP
jgi:hypothetical protein